nr:immunoglobulin heavy chain junction region [Macaca mulatta]MOW75527.1 immunoglobulin heavy chain junction region [Macaca mulatta]MOW76268.1 immunoglobulin heavy chain junction region [Macaca mulatta]MOW76416.1 immunoglobulin heavy chain junction region [Macaca mulatta]MOW76427.1 immunoglobulin heavy chain junction region [Macaca mulatta]
CAREGDFFGELDVW